MNISVQNLDFNIGKAYELLLGKLEGWLETAIEMLPNLVLAILTLIVFYVIGKLVRKGVNGLLHKVTNNKTIIDLLETIVGVLIIGIGIFAALGILNLDGTVKSLLAGAGIVGLALGFAFQDIAANFISGILLSMRHPFGKGDIIESNDYYGYVEKINLRNTVIKTPQGQFVFIPNKVVYENPFINYTKNFQRRVDLDIGVSYADDHEKAKKVAIEAVESIDSYNKNREVELFYTDIGGSTFNYTIRFWVDFRKNPDYLQAKSDAIIAIGKAYEEHDIDMSYPIRTLDFGVKGGVKLDDMLIVLANNANGQQKADQKDEEQGSSTEEE